MRGFDIIFLQKHRHLLLLSLCITLVLGCLLTACTSNGTGVNSTLPELGTATSTSASSPSIQKPIEPLTDIRMLDQMQGWALTKDKVLKTTDGGQHWQDVTPTNYTLGQESKGDFLDTNHAWVAVYDAQRHLFTVLSTTDGGTHWQSSTIRNAAQGLLDPPHFINQQEGWLEIGQALGMSHTSATIYHTTDGGQSWNNIASTDIQASGLPITGNKTGISFKDSHTGWATADTPATYAWLYMTNDGGKTWQRQSLADPQGTTVDQFITTPPVLFGNDGILPVKLAYGPQGKIGIALYVTHDGGQRWAPTAIGDFSAATIYVADMQHAWAAENGGNSLYGTSDGGQTWQKLSTLPQPISAMSFVDDLHGWAIGNADSAPLLLSTGDGGKSWQTVAYTFQ